MTITAWSFVALVATAVVWNLRELLGDPTRGSVAYLVGSAVWLAVPLTSACLGAFVVTRRPDHLVGWLLLVPGLAVANVWTPTVDLATPPEELRWTTFLGLAYDNASWILLVLPIFLILALFPTGRPVSPRWRWHSVLVGAMGAVMITLSLFSQRIGPAVEHSWSVDNPIGFIPSVDDTGWFAPLWGSLLLAGTLGGVAAMVTRFRRARWTERQQIKGLLAAVALFAIVYSIGAINDGWSDDSLLSAGLGLTMLLIPVSIATAILRTRVFDIDLVVRRTVLYAVVTASLAATFAGSVVVLQAITQRLTGTESSLSVAASTLLIAALFNPLRTSTQALLDRRFFRSHYDPERTLALFAARARDELDPSRLTDELVAVVGEVLRPGTVTLWRPPAV